MLYSIRLLGALALCQVFLAQAHGQESDIDRLYASGSEAYKRNEYEVAQSAFTRLYAELSAANDPRAAPVAYAAAQSSRYRSEFALAFYYYGRALIDYDRYGENAQEGTWRAEAELQMREAGKHLMRVTLDLRDGTLESSRVRICDIRLKGRKLVPTSMLDLPQSIRLGCGEYERELLGEGEQRWLPAGETGESEKCDWQETSRRVVVIVARGAEYNVAIDRRVDGEKRPARLSFSTDQAADGPLVVRLADEQAKVVLAAAPGSSTPADPRQVQGTLASSEGTPDYQLIWARGIQVAAGSYKPAISAEDYEVNGVPDPFVLMPAETRRLEVKLEDLPWYKRPWVWVGGVSILGAVVAGTALAVHFAGAAEATPVDRGTLGSAIRVP